MVTQRTSTTGSPTCYKKVGRETEVSLSVARLTQAPSSYAARRTSSKTPLSLAFGLRAESASQSIYFVHFTHSRSYFAPIKATRYDLRSSRLASAMCATWVRLDRLVAMVEARGYCPPGPEMLSNDINNRQYVFSEFRSQCQ